MRARTSAALMLWITGAAAAGAEPLDLRDATPRAVQVAFEVSPTERPDALDAVYSAPLLALLEPGFGPTQVVVRVPGASMEGLLAHFDPVPGSFSDYVWTFDSASGEVIEARFQGRLQRPVSLGLLDANLETRIDVRVGTRDAAGFLAPQMKFGLVVVGACEPARHTDCTAVEPAPLDPRRGYVNAVGTIRASALGGLGAVTFAPLGEAIFSELLPVPAVSLAAD